MGRLRLVVQTTVFFAFATALVLLGNRFPPAEFFARRQLEKFNSGARQFEGNPVTAIEFGECDEAGDDSLLHLESFRHLRRLSLVYLPSVTDRGMEHLTVLTQLTDLHFYGVPITSAGIARLKGLKKLRVLELINTHIDNRALEHLAALPNLEELTLSSDQMTDDGLVFLEGMKALRVLNLYGAQITDKGLPHLKKLTQLESVDIDGAHITRAGIADLKKALQRTRAPESGLKKQ
jgi:hypothetical protein